MKHSQQKRIPVKTTKSEWKKHPNNNPIQTNYVVHRMVSLVWKLQSIWNDSKQKRVGFREFGTSSNFSGLRMIAIISDNSTSSKSSAFVALVHQKCFMGPFSKLRSRRAIRYSGFLFRGPWSVGPFVGEFLDFCFPNNSGGWQKFVCQNLSGWQLVGNEGMNPHHNHVWFHSLIPY